MTFDITGNKPMLDYESVAYVGANSKRLSKHERITGMSMVPAPYSSWPCNVVRCHHCCCRYSMSRRCLNLCSELVVS